jgi:hypothetical protein
MGEEEKIAMNRRHALVSYILIACSLVIVLVVRAADTRTGDWTMRRSDEPGKVEFSLITHQRGGFSHHESDWPVGAFQGLDLSKQGKQDAKFTIARDAGRFDCQGYLENAEGAGTFHFVPDPNYAQQMKSLGFPVDEDKQFFMAAMDVSLDFVRRIKAENLEGLDIDKLIAFRIHGVSPEFIDALRKAGLPVKDSDNLIAFRIHGVSPEMVRSLHQAGYQPDEDTLVAMRIHGATPEFIEQLGKLGYTHMDLEQLIAFRIHGVSPEFIEKLHGLGYKNPSPDELVAMRIHGVTPEYIAGLKSRGMKDLSIDQLVSMRIHGID